MRFRGLRLLRVGGIQIVIDYSWFVIFFLVMYTMAENYFPQTERQRFTTPQFWLMGLVGATLLFISVLLHELAHSFVALWQGIRVNSIRLFIFGGVAQVSSEPGSGRSEFLIALAGPATSLVLALLFGAVSIVAYIAGGARVVAAIAQYVAIANFILGLFNMIPGFPLDGGRILRAILWDRWNDMARATRVVSQIGNAFALFLMVLGVLQFFVTQSLLSGLWLVFIGLFMKQSALGSYQAVVVKAALSGVPVSQVMTENVVTVDWLTPIDELVREYIYKHQFTHFPVFNRDELVGMVSLGQVKSVPKEVWVFKQVRDLMTPLDDVPVLKPADDAVEALTRMASPESGPMLVLEEGRLVGIVSRRDIMNLFRIKSDLGVA